MLNGATMNTQAKAAPLGAYQTAINEYGMAAFVFANTRGGFNVTLRDMDAEMTVPVAYMFSTLDAAIAKANELV
jgi:hypothetical protein